MTARDGVDKGPAALERVVAAGGCAEFLRLDLTDSASIESAAEFVRQKYGKIDALVNNAGFAFHGDIFGAWSRTDSRVVDFC